MLGGVTMTSVLKLLNVTTKSMSIENNFYDFNIDKNQSIVMDLSDFDIYKSTYVNNDDSHLYRIDLCIKNTEKANLPFKFNIEVGCIVKTNTDNAEMENSLINYNAIALLYQICREKLAVLNTTMELPVFRLPIINLMDNEKEIKEIDDDINEKAQIK